MHESRITGERRQARVTTSAEAAYRSCPRTLWCLMSMPGPLRDLVPSSNLSKSNTFSLYSSKYDTFTVTMDVLALLSMCRKMCCMARGMMPLHHHAPSITTPDTHTIHVSTSKGRRGADRKRRGGRGGTSAWKATYQSRL